MLTELVVGIALPFLIPSLFLAIARVNDQTSFWEAIGLNEVAFGFGSVAVASIVRTVSIRTDWKALIVLIAALVLGVQTTIGVTTDTTQAAERYIDTVQATITGSGRFNARPETLDLRHWRQFGQTLVREATAIESEASPQTLWVLSIAFGLIMVGLSTVFIVRVRDV